MTKRANNEGTVTQRADGRWEARLSVGYLGGKRRRKCVYGATQAEVVAKVTKLKEQLRSGLPVPNEKLTVAAYLTTWLETAARSRLRPTTFAGYEANVRVHIVPAIGRITLARLKPQDVDKLIAEMLKAGKAPRTVQYVHAVLRAALADAVRNELVARNVAALARGPAVKGRAWECLSPEQMAVFLKAIRGDRHEALYLLAFTTGLRQGELLGLRWQDIDLEDGVLHVAQALQRAKGDARFGAPKTERSRRTLHLPQLAITALKEHRTRQIEGRLVAGSRWQDFDLVFATSIGTPLDHRNVTRNFQRALEAAGLPRQRFHDARHAFASMLLANGEHPRVVMDILGHSQIALTMNTYSHVIPALKEEAARKVDRLLGAG